MEVFHYVALQLQGVPLFENSNVYIQQDIVAVYNDFDFDPSTLLVDNDEPCFSQSYNANVRCHDSSSDDDLVPDNAVECAILEADVVEGCLYNETTFDHPLFDCESETADVAYMKKVHAIATEEFRNIPLSLKRQQVFAMRHRQNWQGADSVYDAWLISNELSRPWFPYRKFVRIYPTWEEYRNRVTQESDEELAAPINSKSCTEVNTVTDVVAASTSCEKDFIANYFLQPAVKEEPANLTRFRPNTTVQNVIIISDDSDCE